MYRYVAYYKYSSKPRMKEEDVVAVNEFLDSDPNQNPMITQVLQECVNPDHHIWKDVPLSIGEKVARWNWKIKDSVLGYVEILSKDPLTEKELEIMENETYAQICDGYNENPFNIRLQNGSRYKIMFNEWPEIGFKEA